MGTYERTTTYQSAATTDDGAYYNGAYAGAQVWYWVGRRLTGTTGAWVTYLFPVPADVDPDAITSVTLKLWSNGAGTSAATVRVKQGAGVAPASSGDQRPDTAYNAVGTTGEVDWGFTTTAAGQEAESPDISSRVISALNLIDQSTEKLSIHLGPDTAASGTANVQMYSRDYNTDTALRPTLVIVETLTDNPTMTPSVVGATTAVNTPDVSSSYTLSYTNGTALVGSKDNTATGSRTATLYLPPGTSASYGHADGFPVAVWLHGGFFNEGSRNELPSALRDGLLSRGVAVLTPDYRLTEAIADGFEYLANGNEASFPLGIHDVKVAIRYLTLDHAGSNLYDIDTQQVLMTGHSAGTSIASFVAFTKGDTATYSGMYPGSWGAPDPVFYPNRWYRPAHVNRSNTASYPFDFHQNGDTVSDTTLDDFGITGLFLFAPAISLQNGVNATLTPDADARYFISLGRRYYVSRDAIGTIDTTVYGEMDVDKYIDPAAGTPTINEPYLGKADVVPDFPIGVVQGTSDVLTSKAAQYDTLVTALTNVGYIESGPTQGVTNSTGLSYYELSGVDHDGAKSNATGIANFFDWYDAISTPVTGGTAEPTAVAATATVPAAAWGVETPATVVAAVTAVPAPVWGAGWLLSSTTSIATIAAQAGVGGGFTTPTVVSAVASIPAPETTGGGGTSAAVLVTTSTVPAPAWGAGWVLSSVTATSAIPTPGAVGNSVVSPSTVVATSTTPTPSWGAGWVLSSVTATTTIAAQAGVGGGFTTPATVGAAVAVPTTSWGAGWVPTTVTASTTIPVPDTASGGTATPSTVAATTTIPSAGWGQSILLSVVTGTTAIPSLGWRSAPTVAVVAATTTIPSAAWSRVSPATAVTATSTTPAPTWGAGWLLSTVAASSSVPQPSLATGAAGVVVAAQTAVPAPSWGAGWVLSTITAVTEIRAQAGVGNGLATPSSTNVTTAVGAPSWGAAWVLTVTTAQTTIPMPDTAGGMTMPPVAITATAGVSAPSWGAGWVLTSTGSTSTIPSTGWGTSRTPTVVGIFTAIPAPAISGGGIGTVSPVTATTTIPSPTSVVGMEMSVAPVAAISYVMAPTIEYGSVIAVMAVAVLVSIGAARPSALPTLLFSYSDGKSVTDGVVSYFDGVTEVPFGLEYTE